MSTFITFIKFTNVFSTRMHLKHRSLQYVFHSIHECIQHMTNSIQHSALRAFSKYSRLYSMYSIHAYHHYKHAFNTLLLSWNGQLFLRRKLLLFFSINFSQKLIRDHFLSWMAFFLFLLPVWKSFSFVCRDKLATVFRSINVFFRQLNLNCSRGKSEKKSQLKLSNIEPGWIVL